MTSIRVRRCAHCLSRYGYQQSGPGCGDGFNDAQYCPKCKGAIHRALTAIPVLFERRYLPVSDLPEFSDVTAADIEVWEADFARRRRESGAIIAQRVWPGLMDLDGGDTQNVREVKATSGPHQGTRFRVSSWWKRPDYLIEVPIEWDITRQVAVGLWRD